MSLYIRKLDTFYVHCSVTVSTTVPSLSWSKPVSTALSPASVLTATLASVLSFKAYIERGEMYAYIKLHNKH